MALTYSRTDYPLPVTLWSVNTGDFNGDGHADLVTANIDSNGVSVLLGNGDGTFGAATTFATGTGPSSIAIADLNDDGRLDLTTSNVNSSNVSVLLGNGLGGFGSATNFSTGTNPRSVVLGDLNGDGKLDLVTSNQSSSVSVLLGNGGGTFGAATNITVGAGIHYALALSDFNVDGKLDLAVAGSDTDDLLVLLGNGDGTFGASTAYAVGTGPNSVAFGDFNGDGQLDLATGTGSTVSVLLGAGDGTFGAATQYDGPGIVKVADVNGDGKLDLVTSNVSVLLGNGDGTFAAASNFAAGSQPSSVAIGDLDGIGLPDLVVVNYSAQPPFGAGSIAVLLSNDSPTITSNGGGDNEVAAFYAFDETGGSIAHDQQGEHDGTIFGATQVPGVTGNALQFNEPSDFVSVPDSPEWNLGSDDFTIEFWANFNSVPGGSQGSGAGGVPIGQDEGVGPQNKWFFEVFSGGIGFHVNTTFGNGFFIAAPFEPTPGQWYAFALTRSGSSYQFYVDGQLVGSADAALAIPDVAAPLTLGQAEGAFFFDGQLDGVAIHHRALSQAEVQQGFDDGAAVPGAISISEDTTVVTTVTATDLDTGQTLSYSIAGGADAELFTIDATTGELMFVNTPNYENPADDGTNNVYDVTVEVSDGNGGTDTQAIAVTITNQHEAPATASATVTTAEDTTYTFTLADFAFNDDADQPSDTLRHIVITSMPAAGTLLLDGVAITAAQAASGLVIAPAAIASGLLTFTPAADANGNDYAAFDFHVRDGGVGAGTAGNWIFSGSGADDSGNDHHLTLTGGAGFAPGLFGEALVLDGAKDSGAVLNADPSAFDFGSSDFTVELWVKFDDLGRESVLIEKWTDDSGPGWTFTVLEDDRLQFFASGVAAFTTGPLTIATGEWHQFVAERSGDTFNIFMDGELVLSEPGGGAIIPSSGPLLIGGRNAGDPRNFTVDGLIDNVTIWDHALSTTEISQHWNGGAGIDPGESASQTATVTIDVTAANDTPTITSDGGGATASVSVVENTTAVTTVVASDPDTAPATLSYSITGGADAAKFTINSTTGALAFANAPDFEVKADAGADNVYDVTVQVSDDNGGVDTQAISVTVQNVAGVTLNGTSKADTRTGSGEEDIINGLGGNDTLNGLAGNDVLNGGAGNDRLDGGTGNDAMTGGTENDIYVVDSVGDTVTEAAGQGTDTIETTLNSFSLGSVGNLENLTFTGTGDFVGTGNALSNTIRGGNGNDRFVATIGDGNDIYFGGSGVDTIDLSGTTAAATVTDSTATSAQIGRDGLSGIENVIGSQGNDQITGTGAANVIDGGTGNDNINAGGGADRLIGGAGNDTMDGGGASDSFVFSAGFGNDSVTAFDANPSGGQDLLDISAFGIGGNFATRVTIADVGADTLVTIDGDPGQTIRLVGIGNAATVTQADFLL